MLHLKNFLNEFKKSFTNKIETFVSCELTAYEALAICTTIGACPPNDMQLEPNY